MTPTSTKHTLQEDALGILFGTTMASFGIIILTHLGLVTGQTAGLAVLISYATGWSFGPVFFVVNLPFYYLGYKRLGKVFTIKTLAAVSILSVLSTFMPRWISFEHLDPIFGALLFGALVGTGLLALIRHGASLGGIGIVAIYLQDKTGFKAGYTQLLFDAVLFIAALFLREPLIVFYSFIGAFVVNIVIAVNHRRDRYIAT
ncbi:YitT family protein [Marivivens sp. LCG002]|uniref:YitT family protein n=1 Tax=Marivivens sp. LCG002 TaxID=3051171 RepID=UPI002553366E|nr:YitT family protein [Marivivens sp. LCG002]WIV52196.1 YitT family protein [Marivivens sp. LCG002]